MKKPVALIILDGFGCNPSDYGNAITAAKKPNLDKIFSTCPNTKIGASGMDVGLPDGQMGNSEVGHTNIGAGRIVYQELTRITKSIKDGDFFTNKAFANAVANCKKNNSSLHMIGLLSDGGVHSHIEHLYGLLELAKKGYISIQAPARKADQVYTVTIDNDRIFEEAMNAICERSLEESDKYAKLDTKTRKDLLRKKPAECKGRTRNNKA